LIFFFQISNQSTSSVGLRDRIQRLPVSSLFEVEEYMNTLKLEDFPSAKWEELGIGPSTTVLNSLLNALKVNELDQQFISQFFSQLYIFIFIFFFSFFFFISSFFFFF